MFIIVQLESSRKAYNLGAVKTFEELMTKVKRKFNFMVSNQVLISAYSPKDPIIMNRITDEKSFQKATKGEKMVKLLVRYASDDSSDISLEKSPERLYILKTIRDSLLNSLSEGPAKVELSAVEQIINNLDSTGSEFLPIIVQNPTLLSSAVRQRLSFDCIRLLDCFSPLEKIVEKDSANRKELIIASARLAKQLEASFGDTETFRKLRYSMEGSTPHLYFTKANQLRIQLRGAFLQIPGFFTFFEITEKSKFLKGYQIRLLSKPDKNPALIEEVEHAIFPKTVHLVENSFSLDEPITLEKKEDLKCFEEIMKLEPKDRKVKLEFLFWVYLKSTSEIKRGDAIEVETLIGSEPIDFSDGLS